MTLLRTLGALIGAFLLALVLTPAQAQFQGPQGYPSFSISAYRYTNITTDTTTTIKSGQGVLHTICFNTPVATEVITIYDNTAASGTKIGTWTIAASPQPTCIFYDAQFNTGLTILTATAASDITVTWL